MTTTKQGTGSQEYPGSDRLHDIPADILALRQGTVLSGAAKARNVLVASGMVPPPGSGQSTPESPAVAYAETHTIETIVEPAQQVAGTPTAPTTAEASHQSDLDIGAIRREVAQQYATPTDQTR